ncbi:MAG: septal ring lytic transglycosylase RlpA family protein [Candidatus Obscuribacterales bacterium]|nr:septal ring lytic transglycosylase RlpA family protein [Candidatus Obscuribacterales bacterium]
MKIAKTLIVGTIVGASTLWMLGAQPAQASEGDLPPDICTTVFMENNEECACVSINGVELITYRDASTSNNAEQKAEQLSLQIQKLISNNQLKVEDLLPSRDGQLGAIQIGDETLVKFEVPDTEENFEAGVSKPVAISFKLVNAIRGALGSSALPDSFMSVAEAINGGKNAILKAGRDCFSGRASWYGKKFHGRRAANGERYDMNGLTAAHRSLPFGTKLLVTNRSTGSSCVVEVNDRGPYHGNRIIDLSKGAAEKLKMVSSGIAMVDVVVLGH